MPKTIKKPSSLFSISGKVAVITGASGAFGRVAATALAVEGARLALVAGNARALAETAAECRAAGADVVEILRRPSTIADAEEIVAQTVDTFGQIDILVSAAGTNDVAPIQEMDVARFEAVMHANVTGSWIMAKVVADQFIKQATGGKIVLMSSARGILGHPAGYSAYCASKSAIDGIVRALGCELGKYNITVNAIAPTVFRSDLTAWMFEDTERAVKTREGLMPRIPLGRLGEPEDLAGPLLFLSSAASNFYTGHILYADGGYTAG
ncbi:SDR family oxidoreductase [Agrobacterium vitis]|uniref:SDR family oxidoreductase n=1 Tax=Agrobacterium vitis TaxID=373 RepID=A0A6L6VJL4_AGRVI|nr:SDR family oxidoreductase [Agrobacterium vitis]MUZ76023.1 SDR family oxidoreductase [Agrobacterium vitis]